jgi:hypothetical protein
MQGDDIPPLAGLVNRSADRAYSGRPQRRTVLLEADASKNTKRALSMRTLFTFRRLGAGVAACTLTATAMLFGGGAASAAIAPAVALATSANYAVLGASTVTNTGNSTLDGSLGLWPGTSITGFPPGLVLPPGTTDVTNGPAQQAQSDLTAGYIDAAGRPLDATTTADLANLHLGAGVYAGPSKSPLSLTGPLVLDGAGDMTSVFIFQTDSTLITASASTVTLINGAQECNVFWQVGSSATLGSGSVFTGNILALTSVTVNNSVTVHGRALARNGAVTLDNDMFTRPTCAQAPAVPPTTTTAPPTTTTPAGSTTTPVAPGGAVTTTTTGGTITGETVGGGTPLVSSPGTPSTVTSGGPATPGTPSVPGVVGPPRTGGGPLARATSSGWWPLLLCLVCGAVCAGAVLRRRCAF